MDAVTQFQNYSVTFDPVGLGGAGRNNCSRIGDQTGIRHKVTIAEESFHGISNLAFTITLTRPALVFNSNAILSLHGGNTKFANGLQTYLMSRDHHNLKSEFQLGSGKVKVDCIENQPTVDVILGQHVFLSVGDHFLSTKAR
ncbi:tRNA synthetase class I (I, L, M and V) family protein [Actinidia rufa]|uniref:tRNA synthetase class I (I, L, M and V) family protein n=1 Tax=Actinidia rufa TaxID=165716 RepID=A0A7J0F2C7_9ERIC|nr:tRNA synthetase class I (I, L, M and V) family protein [Actinidia rufa]